MIVCAIDTLSEELLRSHPEIQTAVMWNPLETLRNSSVKEIDAILIVGFAGQDLSGARVIGELQSASCTKISTILIGDLKDNRHTSIAALQAVRPWSNTLALIEDPDDLVDMLKAFDA